MNSLQFTVYSYRIDKLDGFLRLDAVQGSSEAQTELYFDVLRRSTAAADTVMRQEFWQSFGLCSKAGQNGGGVS